MTSRMRTARTITRGAGALCALLCSRAGWAQTPCSPAAALEGEPALTAELGELLRGRGVGAPATGCPAVQVWVESHDGVLSVAIRDAGARESRRVVAGLDVAAALVESWARTDISGPLMSPPPPDGASLREAPVVAGAALVLQRPGDPPRSLALRVAGETTFASDGSLWFGAQVAGCVRLGRTCIGALARFAQDSGLTEAADSVEAARKGAELIIGAELPYHVGRGAVTPGFGLGVGWLRTTVASAAGGTSDVDSGGLRAEANLAIRIPLSRRLSIDVGLGLAVSPLARSSQELANGATLPGEPRGYLRALGGLRYGEP